MTEHGTGPIEKFCSIRVSRRGLAAGAAATLAARRGLSARAQDSTPVAFDDETFDAAGATLRVASWGGSWQQIERTYLLDQFQKDFNCTVQYANARPWLPGFVAGGMNNPPFDVTTWNQPELNMAGEAGGAPGGFFGDPKGVV